jgi:20S proteasome subunit alpha 7
MATATGAGYDYSVGTYSPEGRIFQVEYAQKAVDQGGTALGMITGGGILLAVEKVTPTKLLKRHVNRRIETVDLAAGLACTGYLPDIRAVASRARDESLTHRETFEDGMSVAQLAERLALFMHAYTLYASVRPFGVGALLCGLDARDQPRLYLIDPEGVHCAYAAVAIGKGRQWGRTELEKLNPASIEDVHEAMVQAARIILAAASEAAAGAAHQDTELEFSWLDLATKRHQAIDGLLAEQAVQRAKDLLAAELQYHVS